MSDYGPLATPILEKLAAGDGPYAGRAREMLGEPDDPWAHLPSDFRSTVAYTLEQTKRRQAKEAASKAVVEKVLKRHDITKGRLRKGKVSDRKLMAARAEILKVT